MKQLARNFNKDLTPRSRPGSSVLVVGPDSLVVGLFASLPEGGASVSGSEPRSGVRGLTPFQVRFQALENGWAALPIVRHDAADKGAGKRPVIAGWEAFAEFGADLPTLADLNDWDARFGHAPGTGLPMGNEVAIDLDFLRDPTLAKRAYDIAVAICGETPFVRQGQAPKTALVYRAAEPIETIRLKADDGSGEGLDVLGGGAQLVAYGIHPNTLEPYKWIGAASPLTATPYDAPTITNAQVQGVLAELGRFVELTSGSVKKSRCGGGGGGGFGTIVRTANGLVTDGREAWLTLIVHQQPLRRPLEASSRQLLWRAAPGLRSKRRPFSRMGNGPRETLAEKRRR